MPYVVRCSNLEELYQRWIKICDGHRNEVPDARFKQGPTEVRQLAADLANFSRIQWLHFSDTSTGIALRLYDTEFRQAYERQHFREIPKGDGEEWVILRGFRLGPPPGVVKREMLNSFAARWKVSEAPKNPLDPRERFSLGTSSEERVSYFEHPNLNNASGGTEPRMSTVTELDAPNFSLSHADALRQFGQIIFYGPPGTGKTRTARRIALEILAPGSANATEEQVSRELHSVAKEGRFNLVVSTLR